MTNDKEFAIVFSPVQMAAVLQGASIDSASTSSNRLWGSVGILGGAIELVGAGALLLAPDPTAVTKIGAGLLGAHGIDTLSASARQVWTAREQRTLTAKAAASAACSLGLNSRTSDTIGTTVDIAVPFVVGGVLGALRVLSIRAGFIDLLAEEAAGGHTLARHVGKSEAWLRLRLAAEPHISAAGSFRDVKEATRVISQGIRANARAINAALRAANVGGRYAFEYNAGKAVGYGIPRATNVLQDMTKIRVIVKKVAHGGKIYFLLTAFPIP